VDCTHTHTHNHSTLNTYHTDYTQPQHDEQRNDLLDFQPYGYKFNKPEHESELKTRNKISAGNTIKAILTDRHPHLDKAWDV